jgi:demethylmenaquinone methyltransferase / 2-methoxy-6-polyprenyl-1,4-benzoquinol methylase
MNTTTHPTDSSDSQQENKPESWSPQEATEGKAVYVQSMFNRIAGTYDLLNDCISFGMHRLWKNKACDLLQLQPGHQVLDVCTGTGDLLPRLAQRVANQGQVIGLDFSEEMLEVGRKRFTDLSNIQWQQGDAMALPFEDNTFDGAIVSFGLRNVSDIQKTVNEMARVVKPGGWVVNLDTNPKPAMPGFKLYFSMLMPMIGQLFSMDKKAYQYLSESTWHFLTPEELGAIFQQAGLTHVQVLPLSMGAVSIQRGQVI